MTHELRPLVLAGFMGTGKTTIGKLVARRLQGEFIDLDREIEAMAGMAIADVFAQLGEAAFRALESQALERVLLPAARVNVISVGGGAVVNAANRRRILDMAVTVCLTAEPDEILKRVGDVTTRPLLNVADPRARIRELLAQRQSAYGQMHYRVDTTHVKPGAVASRIARMYRAEFARIPLRIPVVEEGGAVHEYDIVAGAGVLVHMGELLSGRGWTSPLAIVTDTNVQPGYAQTVADSLERAGMRAFVCGMPAGEEHKTLATVQRLYEQFAAGGLERGGAVIALGGGVVGDTAGFAAATWLRGVPLVQAPTSLLAMADSSIGGKVGVDAVFGKNLVGAFKQPQLVVMDLDCLATLPAAELACGWAEIIKAAFISGELDGLLEVIEAAWGDPRRAFAALLPAMQLKRRVVQEDPFEHGKRAWLNLGHTFGHGIETWSDYAIPHGQAVALGMLCAVRLSRDLDLCDTGLEPILADLLRAARLPTCLSEVTSPRLPAFDAQRIWALMQSDKKKRAGKLRFVVIHAAGDVRVSREVEDAVAQRALASIAEPRDGTMTL